MLISKCDRVRWIDAAVVSAKGSNEYPMVGSWFAEVLVMSDNEPATALKEALKLADAAVKTEESAPERRECLGSSLSSSHIELLKVQRCGSLRWIG